MFSNVSFFVLYNETNFILRTTSDDYRSAISRYTKIINNKKSTRYTKLSKSVLDILKNPTFKLIYHISGPIDYNERQRIYHLICSFFQNDIMKVRNCQEYLLPPIKEPIPENQYIIGDIVEENGTRYIVVEDEAQKLTFDEATKKYINDGFRPNETNHPVQEHFDENLKEFLNKKRKRGRPSGSLNRPKQPPSIKIRIKKKDTALGQRTCQLIINLDHSNPESHILTPQEIATSVANEIIAELTDHLNFCDKCSLAH